MQRPLIELAKQLATLEPGKPRQTTLRRSVSTAYYAVFHGFCRLAADTLVGKTSPYSEWTPIYRSLDHGVFQAIVRDQSSKSVPLSRDVARILNLAIDLRRQREEADYNPTPLNLGRVAVQTLISSAESALDALDKLPVSEQRALAIALVARHRRK
jgi:uncharacterized protein (UPF0332 family)